jgi:hypothetical protein
VPSIQNYAYSKTMDALTENCKKTTVTKGYRAFGVAGEIMVHAKQ